MAWPRAGRGRWLSWLGPTLLIYVLAYLALGPVAWGLGARMNLPAWPSGLWRWALGQGLDVRAPAGGLSVILGPQRFLALVQGGVRFFTGVEPFDPPALLAAALFLPLPAAVPRPAFPSPGPPVERLGGPAVVGIYETYTTESFRSFTGRGPAYTQGSNHSVAAVGRSLAAALEQRGVGAIYSATVNDTDGLIGAYLNSARVARRLLAAAPTLRYLLDIHRGEGSRSQTTSGGQLALANLNVVVGTNRVLPNPRWPQNYTRAQALVRTLRHLQPRLKVTLRLSKDRLNQELSPGALQIEIGGPDNTLAEENRTAADLAQALASLLGGGSTTPA